MAKQAPRRTLVEQVTFLRVCLYSFLATCSVTVVSVVLQWIIYRDWLHQTGPFRYVGTAIAAAVTFFFVWRWQEGLRRETAETQRRLLVIAEMNDRIRNALQAIECITYAKDEAATQSLRESVDRIDHALRGIVTEVNGNRSSKAATPRTNAAAAILL